MLFTYNHDSVISALDKIVTSIYARIIAVDTNVYWLSVDFRSLIAATGVKHTEAQKAAAYIIDSLVSQLKANETLLISSFYFAFPQSRLFDPQKSEIQTGVFGSLVLNQYPEHRSRQPFYSFLVFGQAYPYLKKEYVAKSTGPDSIFDWIVSNKTELICVGHHYVKSLTSVHHAEHLAQVHYRYEKKFTGSLLLENELPQEIETCFYVRVLETCNFSSLTRAGDKAFREQDLVHTSLLTDLKRPLIMHSINHSPTHKLMYEDLCNNDSHYVDYFGEKKKDHNVITSKVADELYRQELSLMVSNNII